MNEILRGKFLDKKYLLDIDNSILRGHKMARDYLQDIAHIKERKGQYDVDHEAVFEIENLNNLWVTEGKNSKNYRDFFLVRAVTLIEVYVRSLVCKLIDEGTPYIENAQTLYKARNIKSDYAISLALQGKKVSIGEIISHHISVNSISDVSEVFKVILGEDIFLKLEGVYDRWKVEIENEPLVPIVDDIKELKENLARLFETRHIVVHELSRYQVHNDVDVGKLLKAASDFMKSSHEVILKLLHGEYPLTQADMNIGAGQTLQEAIKNFGMSH